MLKSGAKPRQAKSAEAPVFEAPPSMLGLALHAPYTSTSPDLLSTLRGQIRELPLATLKRAKSFVADWSYAGFAYVLGDVDVIKGLQRRVCK